MTLTNDDFDKYQAWLLLYMGKHFDLSKMDFFVNEEYENHRELSSRLIKLYSVIFGQKNISEDSIVIKRVAALVLALKKEEKR
jgi:hypothetical protein